MVGARGVVLRQNAGGVQPRNEALVIDLTPSAEPRALTHPAVFAAVSRQCRARPEADDPAGPRLVRPTFSAAPLRRKCAKSASVADKAASPTEPRTYPPGTDPKGTPMSVSRRQRARGHAVWQVTWRDAGGKQRAETFDSKREAERRDLEIREYIWEGRHDRVDAGTEPLTDAVEQWWKDHVEPTLARTTVGSYAHVLDMHLLPRIGDVPIRDIDSARVIDLQRDLRADGVGPAMVHRVMMVLSGIMRHAVIRGRVDRNPVQPVRIAQPKRKRAIRPLAPSSVEQIRRAMLADDDEYSATLVSVMAYAGLRPAEATALMWEHIGERTILVEQASGDDDAKATKTGAIRTVRLLDPVRDDLASWRATSSPRADSDLIFPRAGGRAWSDDDYKNWRRRKFVPAGATVGTKRPYDLRHSFASLMIQAGYSAVELAAELGHAPTLTLNTYAHVFSEFARGQRIDPVAEIASARGS